VLEGRRKVREKGQSYQDKLSDLYNYFYQGKSKNFHYYSRSRNLNQRTIKIITYRKNLINGIFLKYMHKNMNQNRSEFSGQMRAVN